MTASALSMGDPDRDRLSVEQYHRMISCGILREGEPYELIDGRLVHKNRSAMGEDPMTIGNHHVWVVIKLGKLSRKLERLGCHMRTQQPVMLPPFNEPEPDGAIVVGTEDDYLDRKPTADDVLCAIEVADSSLEYDRVVKYQIYADSGVASYMIINLPDRVIEVNTDPVVGKGRYRHSVMRSASERVAFPAPGGKTLLLPVRQLLP